MRKASGALALAVAMLLPGGPARSQEPTKDPGLPGIGTDILQEIDKAGVKDLFQKVSQAQNMLSRPGQNLMRTRVLLENLRQKADSQAQLLEKDGEVAGVREALKMQDFKDRMTTVVAGDEKTFDEELPKILAEYKLEGRALVKFARLTRATVARDKCKEGIDKINEVFNRIDELPDFGRPDVVGGDPLAQVDALLATINSPGGPRTARPATTETTGLRDILKDLFK